MKKILSLILVIALVAGIAVTGTMAYLTDRDNETNVFTVGDVNIKLSEEYKDYSQLLPGVAVEKKPTIENVGSNDAWVWVTYAVPTALADVVEVTPNNGWTLDKTNKFTQDIEVDKQGTKINYTIFPVLYNAVLEAGKTTTAPAFNSVTLSASVDVKPDGSWFKVTSGTAETLNWNHNDDTNIYVNAYAIQTGMEENETVNTAYDNYVGQWGGLNGVYDPAPEKTTSAGFGTAVNAGGTIVLGEDVTLSNDINHEKETNIILGGNTLNLDEGINVGGAANLSISSGEFYSDNTYGFLDIRPGANDESVVTFTDVDFTRVYSSDGGTSYNAIQTVTELCSTDSSAKITIVYEGCTFNNAKVLVEGLSGKVTNFDVTFRNCVFNNIGNDSAIEVANYCNGTLNVEGCTFNITTTSNTGAIEVTPSSSTAVTINATNNTLNGKKAVVGEDGVTKVYSTQSVKMFDVYTSNTTLNESGNTVTGIATIK